MKRKNVVKGPLSNYMYWPLLLTVLFVVGYFVIVLGLYLVYRSSVRKEAINFATQYGTVQKKLLDEFEIPYALLEYNSKILWMNEAFSQATEKDKKYHKSITSIFPSITRELLEKEEPSKSIQIEWKDKIYRANISRIYFHTDDEQKQAVEDSPQEGIIEAEVNEQYMTALYLFDETELHRHIRENREQQLVSALVYIDNYEEALESIEEVKRSLLVALVDRKVSKYFSERDGIIKKIEKDLRVSRRLKLEMRWR